MSSKLFIEPNTRKAGVARLLIGLVWIPLQLILIPVILVLIVVNGAIDILYELISGVRGSAPVVGVPLTIFVDRIELWNRRNLTFVFTGTKQFKVIP